MPIVKNGVAVEDLRLVDGFPAPLGDRLSSPLDGYELGIKALVNIPVACVCSQVPRIPVPSVFLCWLDCVMRRCGGTIGDIAVKISRLGFSL